MSNWQKMLIPKTRLPNLVNSTKFKPFIFFIFSIFLIGSAVFGAENNVLLFYVPNEGFASTETGCKVWVSEAKTIRSIAWSGECIDGYASGPGLERATYNSNSFLYEGDMLKGKQNGNGTVTFEGGSKISAFFKDGNIDGDAVFLRADGFKYEGRLSDHGPEGHGIGTWPSGARYEGMWHEGLESGHGEIKYPDGSSIDGDFQNGLPNGHINWIGRNGSRFEGLVKDGKRNGIGSYIVANGDSYEGEWIDNFPDGQGSLRLSNGNLYSGQWSKGCFWNDNHWLSFMSSIDTCKK